MQTRKIYSQDREIEFGIEKWTVKNDTWQKESNYQIKRNQNAIPLVWYSGPFLKWTREELKQMITATRNNTDDTRIYRTGITRKQNREEKQFYGHFKRLTRDIWYEKMWTWLRKQNLIKETESLQKEAQNNAIRTNHIEARLDKTQQNSRCR